MSHTSKHKFIHSFFWNVLLTSADNAEYVLKKQALSFPQQFLSEILKFNALFEVEEVEDKLHENSLPYISIKPVWPYFGFPE